ncbi:MAG: hypothetical protein ACO1TE_01140 [Prosthecobacter sp.]
MALKIVRYEGAHVPAVKRFNARLSSADAGWQFPEQPGSSWLPDTPGEEIVEHLYVAMDGEEARGGYILKWQPFWAGAEMRRVCSLYLPLSEGIVNPAYKLLGLGLIHDALKRNPLAFCLGMGGTERPLPQALRMLGWQVQEVPFFFLPLRARSFLRHLRPLQSRRPVRLAASLAATSGAASVGLGVAKWLLRAPAKVRAGVALEGVESFGSWADEAWLAARGQYSLCADRGSTSLNRLYPQGEGASRIVKVSDHGKVVGWFVARSKAMKGHKYFGDMRVGSLIDAMAVPGAETKVAWAARLYLQEHAADIIVCNMQHHVWRTALRSAGWLRGPSNFGLAVSRQLAAAMGPQPYAESIETAHFLRGDGEGPTHL